MKNTFPWKVTTLTVSWNSHNFLLLKVKLLCSQNKPTFHFHLLQNQRNTSKKLQRQGFFIKNKTTSKLLFQFLPSYYNLLYIITRFVWKLNKMAKTLDLLQKSKLRNMQIIVKKFLNWETMYKYGNSSMIRTVFLTGFSLYPSLQQVQICIACSIKT